MKKLTLGLILALVLLIAGSLYLRPNLKNPLTTPLLNQPVKPSASMKDYQDPAGFGFEFPDNLSINKNEAGENTYADLALSSKEVNGSLNLKIADSKYASLDEWLKLNQGAIGAEVKLGNLKAQEIKTSDRLLLGALDQGILFTIEMPLIEEDFWLKVYSQVLASFSFTPPSAASSDTGSAEEVSFEGEEVVE